MIASSPRIVFLDALTFGDTPISRFTDRWPCTVHGATQSGEIVQRLAGHAIAITNKVPFDRATLSAPEAGDLRLIAVAATGTDIIDKTAAAENGVKVSNVPGYAAPSVAQFTIALLLELATRAGDYGAAVKSGAWQASPVFTLLSFPQTELRGKSLGIVGYGSIGKSVAQMARGFGMEILIAVRPGDATPPPGRIPLPQLFSDADVISLHCPLTPATHRLIDAEALKRMKPSAFVINTARGALIDESALISVLQNNRIAGAAVDVISQEPPAADHPMVLAAKNLPNLIVTPHTAWSAREARERLLAEVGQNIEAFLNGQERNLVR